MRALEDARYIIKLKEGYWVANYQKIALNTVAVAFLDLDIELKSKLNLLIEHPKEMDFVESVFEVVGSPYDSPHI